MKTDRLNVHYETLYEIIMNRYDGLTPETIKQTLIHSNFDLGVKHSQKNKTKTLVTKRAEYINSEVTRALKKLSKSKQSKREVEMCGDDTDLDKQQLHDYEYYSHSLVIGEPEITSNGNPSKRNAYYRLNKNITFTTIDNLELRYIANFLYLQFTTYESASVDDEMVKYITNKKEDFFEIEEDKNHSFLVDVFVQITTKRDEVHHEEYSLHLLLALASLRAKIDIQINTKESTYSLNNVLINSLVFKKDTFDIECNGIQVTLSSIKDITMIKSASSNSIRENLQEVDKILCNYSKEFQSHYRHFVKKFTELYNLFLINYS